MIVKFIKMQGLGNDYVYFDCLTKTNLIVDPVKVSRTLSDRHFGIGGDGIVLILPHEDADFEMRMYNADGSEGEMCGNAIRCIGKYVYEQGYSQKKDLRILTNSGVRHLSLITNNDQQVISVRVDMGKPILNGPEIPVNIRQNPVLNTPLSVKDREYRMTCVSMGNPHCVIFVDSITDDDILNYGPLIEHHELFPNRINVEFVQVRSSTEVHMRVWERGSGETMACGTGAAAVGVASALNGLTERRVTVHLSGGDLEIEWADNDRVYMTGPAVMVFSGEVDI